jgi:hypothetical protein
MLQKQCEKFQFAYLLNDCLKNENDKQNIGKFAAVAGLLVSEMSLAVNRILKPFNPILGETFEFFDNDLKFRYLAEQVSHFPAISAYVCESEEFVVFGDTRYKSKFKILKGAMEITFCGPITVLFKKSLKKFTFKLPTMYLKGLIMGTPHFDYDGVIEIILHDSGYKAILEFFEEGRKSKPIGYVEGKILDDRGVAQAFLKGYWNYGLFLIDAEGKDISIIKNLDVKSLPKTGEGLKITQIWKANQDEEFLKKFDINDYKISKYACNLNYMCEELRGIIPICDSRLRPDQTLLESQQIVQAELEKKKIEERQRERHKDFEVNKIKYEPIYFNDVLDDTTKEYIYLYKGGYWEDRNKGNFSKCFDIFAN